MTSARRSFALTRPATPHQRQYARILMREIELPTDVITLLHRRFYSAAGIECPAPGTRLDEALAALTFPQAANLIGVLMRERNEQCGDEDEA